MRPLPVNREQEPVLNFLPSLWVLSKTLLLRAVLSDFIFCPEVSSISRPSRKSQEIKRTFLFLHNMVTDLPLFGERKREKEQTKDISSPYLSRTSLNYIMVKIQFNSSAQA